MVALTPLHRRQVDTSIRVTGDVLARYESIIAAEDFPNHYVEFIALLEAQRAALIELRDTGAYHGNVADLDYNHALHTKAHLENHQHYIKKARARGENENDSAEFKEKSDMLHELKGLRNVPALNHQLIDEIVAGRPHTPGPLKVTPWTR